MQIETLNKANNLYTKIDEIESFLEFLRPENQDLCLQSIDGSRASILINNGLYATLKEAFTNELEMLKKEFEELGDTKSVVFVRLCSGLFDKNGKKLNIGCKFRYYRHEGYLLDDFEAVVAFKDGAFGYETAKGAFTAFIEHDELMKDFLDHIEIIE